MAIIKINEEKCIGCGICVEGCAIDIIRMDEKKKKAVVCYADECMMCEMCIMTCPEDAIVFTSEKVNTQRTSWK